MGIIKDIINDYENLIKTKITIPLDDGDVIKVTLLTLYNAIPLIVIYSAIKISMPIKSSYSYEVLLVGTKIQLQLILIDY